jgi:hypothetical protein
LAGKEGGLAPALALLISRQTLAGKEGGLAPALAGKNSAKLSGGKPTFLTC